MARLKITHIVENLNRGGLERVVIDLVRAQLAAGGRPRVICLFETGSLAPELTALGVAVEACGKRAGIDLRALRRLRALLADDAGEAIVHTHNLLVHGYTTIALAGLPRRRLLNTRHGMGGTSGGRVRTVVYRFSMHWTYVVVAVCEAARRNLVERERLPAAKVVSVPNGIAVESFAASSDEARRALREQCGFGTSTRLVGFVGRLNWAKDLPTLIRAFAQLLQTLPDIGLVLVGDGALRGELTALADREGVSERVRFLGDRSDVRILLRGFDVFAMSSVTEGYSIALLEAAASGLPIVATDVGGNSEITRDGVNGRIVAAGDPFALARALKDVLADPVAAEAMGLRGRAWALDQAGVPRMVERYRVLYESLPKGST